MEAAEFCRAIETYLCRKNGGHLVRIVGPVFEQVCGWAAQGVPLTIAFRGIDRCCDRRQARDRTRRRPVRIEFCEADILDLFDAWRRAVGVSRAAGPDAEGGAAPSQSARRPSLAAHLDRLVIRLTGLRAGPDVVPELSDALGRAVREIDASRAGAKGLRGAARARLVERLAALDRELLGTVRRTADAAVLESLTREAEAELAPFLPRLSEDARRRALAAAVDRLLRERTGLPQVAYE